MFETLLSKTFSVLALQLTITYIVTASVISWFRKQYYQKKLEGLSASYNENNELDLHFNFSDVSGLFIALLIIDFAVFIVLLFWAKNNLVYGLPLFSVWSCTTGIMLALCLISVDENLGIRVLAITASITAIAASYGLYTNQNFSNIGPILFVLLCILLVGNIARLIIKIPRTAQRVWAFFGCILFSVYLVYDFNRLAKANANEALNTWPEAMSYAISIYLDIINLFLEILDAMSK